MSSSIIVLLLSIFWIVLSGKFDAFHLILGVISITIVLRWTGKSLLDKHTQSVVSFLLFSCRFIGYICWHFYQIVLANFHVIYVALHPHLDSFLEPKIFKFKTTLSSDRAKFLLATSITLTPGTVTVKADKDEFLIHALTNKTADECPGEMESRIARVFGEGK